MSPQIIAPPTIRLAYEGFTNAPHPGPEVMRFSRATILPLTIVTTTAPRVGQPSHTRAVPFDLECQVVNTNGAIEFKLLA